MAIILVTNDDGINAPGIDTLARALAPLGDVYVVAPDRERSATGHALTIDKPLRVTRLSERRFHVNGTPTDCVAVGVEKVLPAKPSLIVSGINHGPNLGDDITYSGTVSAAMEGVIISVPSIAVSLNLQSGHAAHFETAGAVALTIAERVLEKSLPYDTLLNVNIPNVPLDGVKGFAFTRQGKRVYDGAIHDTNSPWGEKFYWIGGGTPYWEHGEDTDIQAVLAGYVSITPIQLDLTNYWAMDYLREHWKPFRLKNNAS